MNKQSAGRLRKNRIKKATGKFYNIIMNWIRPSIDTKPGKLRLKTYALITIQ